MNSLNLPAYKYRIEQNGGKLAIFDPIRKKFIILTPEEWVRQHFINYLTQHLGYPASRIRVESGTSYNKRAKRTDILIYNDELEPLVLVECKAAHVAVNQSTFNQISVYNKTLKAKVLICSNGMVHYACRYDAGNESVSFLDQIPHYSDLKT
ncbi:MAG: type I restriction enzyme HsdR N-terminal domain-containing protein [Roseivirga sp.]|nr:type I restriction enzyme HsdR N-terminal domain-containing protein [Roseivirga sp.]